MAIGVTWPIMVLNAKDAMVATGIPFERVRVSKTSSGIIQDRGPRVAENEKLYSQVMIINAQCAPVLLIPGGKRANNAHATMNVTILPKFPVIRVRR